MFSHTARFGAIAFVLLAGCSAEVPPTPARSGTTVTVAALADRTWDLWMDMNVDDPARAGLMTRAPDLSVKGWQSISTRGREILADTEQLQIDSLAEDDLLTYGIVREAAELAVAAEPFYWLQFPIAPNQASFHFLLYVEELSRQPVAEEKDRADYLRIAGYYGSLARQHLERLRQQEQRDLRLPKYLVDRSVRLLTSLQGTLRQDLAIERAVAETPEPARAVFKQQAEQLLAAEIEPAFAALIAYFKGKYRTKAPAGIGLSQYPQGRDYYRYLIRKNSSLQLTAAEIHELGQRRVKGLQAEVMAEAKQLNFKGTVREFFDFLHDDRRFRAKGVEDWEKEYAADLESMTAKLPQMFSKLPASRYKLAPMRDSEQGLALGYYLSPSPTQPEGIFYFGGSDPTGPTLLGTRALAYHEVIPGHHLQFSRVYESKALHKLRSIYWVGGYTEGWAEYGVSLADGLGLFPAPYERIGYRMWQLLMSSRLVADTGINEYGWTLAQAEQFWHDNTHLTPAQIDSEIQRSVAIPGQLLVYRLGFEKVSELRQKAQSELGSRFSLAEFHEVLMADGALPLTTLEAKVARYIERVSAQTTE